MSTIAQGALWIGALIVGLLISHALASWAESKGWIYYRTQSKGGRGAALSNAMAEFEAVVNPAVEHTIEEERSRAARPTEVSVDLDDAPDHRSETGHSSGINP
ncbi:MAG TPA: hypothetical protein VHL52_01945 [Acidimicrobiia bacterium]|nr:hypothetical protein [Acidimicrobiia bacterium]